MADFVDPETNLIIEADRASDAFYWAHKRRFGASGTVGRPTVPFSRLSEKQQKICMTVQAHVNKPIRDQIFAPLRMIIVGQAGYGKSLVLNHIRTMLEIRRAEAPGFNFKAASYTGLSSHNINAETIHSSFKVPIYQPKHEWWSYLDKVVDQHTREAFQNVRILLLDEFQLISKSLFAYLDAFLRKCDPHNAALPFAGRSIILAGDVYQLEPVADVSIFAPCYAKTTTSREIEATELYRNEFKTVYILDTSFRQDSKSDYYSFLCRLKYGQCTEEDVDKLRTRLRKNLTEEDLKTFKDALCVYPTRALAGSHNRTELKRRFGADDIWKIDSGKAELVIAKGAKVMVTRNLTVAGGVYNGSVATVVDVVEETRPEKDEDIRCILVHVPDYDGSVYVKSQDGIGLPVFRMTESELADRGNIKYSRFKRFPLQLFYAATAHKSIGLSLPKLCVFLDSRELCNALDFVTFTRVKTWSDLCLLDQELPYERLMSLTNRQKNFLTVVTREEERLKELECKTD